MTNLFHLTRIKRSAWDIVRKSFLNNQLKFFREWIILAYLKILKENEESQLQYKMVLFLFSS